MKNLFKAVTVFTTLALLVGAMVALSAAAAEGDLTGETDVAATAVETTATQAAELVCGDANNDGAVNMKDVLVVRKYLADLDCEINLDNADTNNDGGVNMKDVLNLRKFLAGIVDSLPVVATEPTAA
ncbi:MAG: dockerin type I repeat-containing protein [Clostridia bacterium]|nr:dockerin type I repeat-containing protein [Clostridia bacterium]